MAIWNERIKEKRTEKGITLAQIAELLNVTEATAQRYESGAIKNVPYDHICTYARFFNCSPSYLMGWEDEAAPIRYSRVISLPHESASVLREDSTPYGVTPREYERLLRYYKALNKVGQEEAIKRIEELTYIDKYTNDHLLPQAAHNDDADDPEQQRLMQEDLDELE